MKNIEPPSESRDSTRIRGICAQVLAFFQEQRSLSPSQRAGYCQTLEDGTLRTERTLGCGIVLTLTSARPKTATLRIGLEPQNFKNWIRSLGDIHLFYTDPFGIEIMFRDGLWGAYIGSHRLPFDLARLGYHEIGLLEIQNGGAYLVAPEDNRSLGYHPLRGSERVLDHRPALLNGEQAESRILPDPDGSERAPAPSGGSEDGEGTGGSESAADRLLRILERTDAAGY